MTAPEERRLSLRQGRIQTRVFVGGAGDPLVFLHGAYGLTWDPFLERLAQSFTVYAPEHPGTTPGAPDGIRALHDLWDLVLYHYELLDALALPAPRLVGHSFGGMVAAEVAATAPERVAKLVLIAPLGLWRDDAPIPNYMVLPEEELPKRLFADPAGPLARDFAAMPQDEDGGNEALIQRMWVLACTGKFVWPLADRGLRRRAHRIAAPTLALFGERDGLVPPVYAKEFERAIPQAATAIVAGAAHVPQLEQLDLVAKRVVEFLR